MTSHVTERFRQAFQGLPADIQRRARDAYQLWQQDHNHPGLHFKQVHATKPIYSVRIGLGWRALGVKHRDQMVWFWIGSHADYDKLLSQL